jgi:hypothetical protein
MRTRDGSTEPLAALLRAIANEDVSAAWCARMTSPKAAITE